MRRFHRAVMLAALLALGPVLAGCENFDPDRLDPFGLNQKKPMPGDRKALFPEGVPGVTQGIPPEYMKGHEDQQPGAAIDVAVAPPVAGQPGSQTASVQPAAPEKPKAALKPKPKPKPKPHQAARTPTQVRVQRPAPMAPAAAQQPAAPQPAQQQPQQAQSPWPAPAAESAPAPWPSAPPSGTFSKQ